MANNEDNDPNDDDDQHVHPWQPNSTPQMPLLLWISKSHYIQSPQSFGDGKPTSS
jgi:hypothetical protein